MSQPRRPESGTFLSMEYVPTAKGSGCVEGAGSDIYAEVSYPGLGGKTIYIRTPVDGSGTQLLSLQTLTVKSGLNADSPSGTFIWIGAGSANWNVSGNFKASITEVSSHAFLLSVIETYTDCTETQQFSLVRTGADNG